MRENSRLRKRCSGFLFNYVYRDAGNFKVHGSLLLAGKLSQKQQTEIVMKLESQEFFIAEQLGVKPLYGALYESSGGMTHEDHVWHSFVGFEKVMSDSQMVEGDFWGTAAELLRRFRNVDDWNLRLSPHWGAAPNVRELASRRSGVGASGETPPSRLRRSNSPR